ncbi:hypothetical protein QUB68_03135 [Microcoleus sp. A006_D1]|uniref:hypothetical protein n=1 Tax=Microcoleus sp. A006_D1 TaxID=3055267 RepID=UPI002FD45262
MEIFTPKSLFCVTNLELRDDWYTLKLKKMEEFVLTCESIALRHFLTRDRTCV